MEQHRTWSCSSWSLEHPSKIKQEFSTEWWQLWTVQGPKTSREIKYTEKCILQERQDRTCPWQEPSCQKPILIFPHPGNLIIITLQITPSAPPKRGRVWTKCKVLAADTACSAQLPKARQWTQGRGARRKHANCILFNLHVHFLVFSLKQLLQVLVCWAEMPHEAVVSVSRLAVWQCPWRCWTLGDTQRSCSKIKLQELLKSLSLSLTKMQRKTGHGASQGEEGEEKHFKGAQELKFHFLYAFLPSIQ